MKCNCKAQIEAKLAQEIAHRYSAWGNHIATLDCAYTSVIKDGQLVPQGFTPVELSFERLVRRNGDKKIKKLKNKQFWSFCPFCGGPADSPTEAAAAVESAEQALLTDSVVREKARLFVQEGRSWRGLWSRETEMVIQILELGYVRGFEAAQKGGV